MCAVNPGKCLLAAILAAVGVLLLVNGFWLQYSWGGSWGTTYKIGVLFVQYVVGFLFVGAAKYMLWAKKDAKRR